MSVAESIRKAIDQRQTTQKDVAMRLGISEQYLSDILRGRRSVSAFVAVRLERVLGLDASKLFFQQALEELDKARKEFKP